MLFYRNVGSAKEEIDQTKGLFKGRQRKSLQEQINQLETQLDSMKRYLRSNKTGDTGALS